MRSACHLGCESESLYVEETSFSSRIFAPIPVRSKVQRNGSPTGSKVQLQPLQALVRNERANHPWSSRVGAQFKRKDQGRVSSGSEAFFSRRKEVLLAVLHARICVPDETSEQLTR